MVTIITIRTLQLYPVFLQTYPVFIVPGIQVLQFEETAYKSYTQLCTNPLLLDRPPPGSGALKELIQPFINLIRIVMYSNHIMYRPYSSQLRLPPQEAGDELKIKNTQSVWHPEMKQVILFLDLSRDPGSNISGHLNGNKLLLEAAPGVSYNKPLRTHLVGQEFMDEIEEGFIPVSFLELKLKYGYRYYLKSCQMCGPNRIKVILGFKKWNVNGKKVKKR